MNNEGRAMGDSEKYDGELSNWSVPVPGFNNVLFAHVPVALSITEEIENVTFYKSSKFEILHHQAIDRRWMSECVLDERNRS